MKRKDTLMFLCDHLDKCKDSKQCGVECNHTFNKAHAKNKKHGRLITFEVIESEFCSNKEKEDIFREVDTPGQFLEI